MFNRNQAMLFCRHEWKILTQLTTESKLEHAMRQIPNATKLNLPHQVCHADRKHIMVLACEKCGKLKIIREKI